MIYTILPDTGAPEALKLNLIIAKTDYSNAHAFVIYARYQCS